MYGSATAWAWNSPERLTSLSWYLETCDQAEHEKAELTNHLRQSTGLELSEEKTPISDPAKSFEFLGHRVRHEWHPKFGLMPRVQIQKSRRADLRYVVK
jgi:RNA-directed DNA polymerase